MQFLTPGQWQNPAIASLWRALKISAPSAYGIRKGFWQKWPNLMPLDIAHIDLFWDISYYEIPKDHITGAHTEKSNENC